MKTRLEYRLKGFGDLFADARGAADVRQVDLAKLLGTGPTYISQLENGHKGPPLPDKLDLCIRVFSMSPEAEQLLRRAARLDKTIRVIRKAGNETENRILERVALVLVAARTETVEVAEAAIVSGVQKILDEHSDIGNAVI